MDVILLKDVDSLGLRGEVVGVARGYARNFLLPRKLAEVATPAKVAELERREARRARHEASTADQAQQVKALLEEGHLRIDATAGETGTLFGSVTTTTIADELWAMRKVRVDRRKIDLHDPIKRLGWYTVAIEVFTGVTADLRVVVAVAGGELPPEEAEAPEAEPEAAPEAGTEVAAAPEAESEAPTESLEPEPAAEPEAEAAPEPEPEPEPAEQEPEPEPVAAAETEDVADDEPVSDEPEPVTEQ